MADLGYTNVKDYTGGKRDWIDAGLSIESDDEDERDLSAAVEDEPVRE